MPAFRSRFHVEIIPFRLSPLTHATDPVKLYEAAASGRPVVATPMDSLRPFARRGVVRLASTAEQFVREISAAAAEGPADGGAPARLRAGEHLGRPRRVARFLDPQPAGRPVGWQT